MRKNLLKKKQNHMNKKKKKKKYIKESYEFNVEQKEKRKKDREKAIERGRIVNLIICIV